MPKNNKSKPYEVGFGKPPAQTRFSKGVSGNPHGRPKGSQNASTVLENTLREKVYITENGVRKKVSKLEALFKQLVNKAISGDLKAVGMFLEMQRSAEPEPVVERFVQSHLPMPQSVAEMDERITELTLKIRKELADKRRNNK